MKKSLVGILSVLAASSIFSGCASKKEYTIETLAKGQYCGITENSSYVLNSQEEFAKLWTETFKTQYPLPPNPEVDFSNYSVIAVYDGELSNTYPGDFTLIHAVEESDGNVEVYLSSKNPEPPKIDFYEIVLPALSQPYEIVKTQKITKPVEWIK